MLSDLVTGVTIETCSDAHVGAWAELRTELWPDGTADEHLRFAVAAVGEPTRFVAFLARDDGGHLLGFAEASLRFDYVNGCSTSPVAFVEGLYVREAVRRRGIGRGLIAAIELWARERGCTELASDALIDNGVSHHAHEGVGFVETERVVFFRKDLDIPTPQ
jgi:aminoglycoside 6'-N-acetyltransferase I